MKKAPGPWAHIKAKAQRMRRDITNLVGEIETLTANSADAITASGILNTELEAWRTLARETEATITTITERTQHAALAAAESFTDHLKSALIDAGLTAYGDGSLIIADGIIHIQTNTQTATVQINGQEQGTFHIPNLVTRIQERAAQLRADATPPLDLLRQIHLAYNLTCHADNKELGTQVQTLAILPHLALLRQPTSFRTNPAKEQYRPYPFEQFRADLHGLLQTEQHSTAGHNFRYASGSDTKGAIFLLVPALGRTAHVGRIWFEKIV